MAIFLMQINLILCEKTMFFLHSLRNLTTYPQHIPKYFDLVWWA